MITRPSHPRSATVVLLCVIIALSLLLGGLLVLTLRGDMNDRSTSSQDSLQDSLQGSNDGSSSGSGGDATTSGSSDADSSTAGSSEGTDSSEGGGSSEGSGGTSNKPERQFAPTPGPGESIEDYERFFDQLQPAY